MHAAGCAACLGGVDDGAEVMHAIHAEVGDGEGAPGHLVRRQLVVFCLREPSPQGQRRWPNTATGISSRAASAILQGPGHNEDGPWGIEDTELIIARTAVIVTIVSNYF